MKVWNESKGLQLTWVDLQIIGWIKLHVLYLYASLFTMLQNFMIHP